VLLRIPGLLAFEIESVHRITSVANTGVVVAAHAKVCVPGRAPISFKP
jgi:hypothetical protein